MKHSNAFVLAAAMIMGMAPAVLADPVATPDVATLLFGNPQWTAAPVGTTITYSYAKTATDKTFGPSFTDKVVEILDKGANADRRTVEMHLFTGANARPAGPFDSVEQNPVLLVVLEENVQELSRIFHGNVRYLKDAIRKAWRDDAKIEKTTVDVDGKPTPGTKITVTPFVDDQQKDQMHGLDGLIYDVEIADSVPGEIATIAIHTPEAAPAKFSEVLHYVSEAKP